VGAAQSGGSVSVHVELARCSGIHTEDKKLDSQEEPGKAQSIGGLDCLLSDYKTVYAVSKICSKSQNAQHCRWWHEHPGMIVKRHDGEAGLAKGELVCVGAA
jgi:hypothetical protein